MLRLVMYGMPAAQAFHQGIHLDISRLRFSAPEPPPEKNCFWPRNFAWITILHQGLRLLIPGFTTHHQAFPLVICRTK